MQTLFSLVSICIAPMLNGAEEQQPNIIFIFSDDHAPHSIGAYGNTIRETPNLDRLADEGAIFLNNFSNNAICCPSRAAVLTGTHSHVNQVYTNWSGLNPSLNTTFPEVLNAAGYQTALFGKWHLKFNPTGFEDWAIFPDQGNYYNPTDKTATGNVRHEGYSTDATTNLAMQWLAEDRDADRPFLLCVQYKAPHQYYMPGPKELEDSHYKEIDFPEPTTLFDDYSTRSVALSQADRFFIENWDSISELEYSYGEKSSNKALQKTVGRMNEEQLARWNAYYDSIPKSDSYKDDTERKRAVFQRFIKNYYMATDGIDRNIGRLLTYLETNDLLDNTIIVYSSDHGYFLGEHGQRGKRWFYEETARMPLIISWPGTISPGTRIEALTQNVDYAPFFAEVAEVEMPELVQGQSFLPLLKGEKMVNPRDAIYYTYYQPRQGVEPHEGVRNQRYKLIYYYQIDAYELFDLNTDPTEIHNRYGIPEYASVQTEMLNLLQKKRTELQAHSYDTLLNEDFELTTPRTRIKEFNKQAKAP